MMVFLCVTDKEFADRLISGGNKLFRQQKDIEGNDMWFFDSSHVTFDIDKDIQNGKGFFSNTTSIVF